MTETAGSAAAAVSVPFACAIFEMMSGIYLKNSTPPSAQQGQFPWGAEASAFSQGFLWQQREH